MKILLASPSKLDRPGVWALVNTKNKRVIVTPAPVLLFSILDRLRRFSYQDHHQNPDLVQDYLAGDLSVAVLELMDDYHPILGSVLKHSYVQSFLAQGWKVYEGLVPKVLPFVVPVPEHDVVYVVLKPEVPSLNLEKHLVVGVFKDGHRAREWVDQYYPEWRRGKAVDRVTMASNPLTRRYYVRRRT